MRRADRKNGPGSARDYVRARPFRDWLNARLEWHRHGLPSEFSQPALQLLEEIGWPTTSSGARKLYRYRYGVLEGSVNGEKKTRRTEWYPRELVEDALHMAGVDFYSMYPEFAHEQNIPLEETAWCPSCAGHTTPVAGVCPWCEWRISDGHMNGLAA
jgi:hypothetical protein